MSSEGRDPVLARRARRAMRSYYYTSGTRAGERVWVRRRERREN